MIVSGEINLAQRTFNFLLVILFINSSGIFRNEKLG